MPSVIAKMLNENDLKCIYKQPILAYFDIETYDTEIEYNDCPIASR